MILYDENCGFCRWSLSKIIAWARRGSLRTVPLRSEEAARLLGSMGRERKMASWHLVTPEGRIYSGGDAVATLARLLPGGAPVAALAAVMPGPTRWAYGWVAAHRDRLGRVLGERACGVRPAERAPRG